MDESLNKYRIPWEKNQIRSWDWVFFKPGNANKAFPKQSRKFSMEIKKKTVNQGNRRCLGFLWHGASMVPIEKRLFLNEQSLYQINLMFDLNKEFLK